MLGLVDYSDDSSSSDLEENIKPIDKKSIKKGNLPPLPARFWDLYSNKPRIVSTDSSFHDGKVRVNTHVDGLWPSHVYLEWLPNSQSVGVLDACIDCFSRRLADDSIIDSQVKSLVRSDLNVNLPLHISLSESIMLPSDEKEQFESAIMDECEEATAKNELNLTFSGAIKIFLNKTKTRAFIALVLNENVYLNDLIKQVNYTCQTFKKPVFHDILPHISIAWLNVSSVEEANALTKEREFKLDYDLKNEVQKMNLCFYTAKLKIGNVVTSCKLTGTLV